MDLFLSLAFLAAVVGGQYLLLVRYEHQQKNGWKLVADGVYEKVQTVNAPISIKGFTNFMLMMVNIATIFFQDGKTCATMGITGELPEPGTRIRIFKNGLAEFRVERV